MNSYDPLSRPTGRTETDEQLLDYVNQPVDTIPAEVTERAQETAPVITPPPATETTEGAAPAAPQTPQQQDPEEDEDDRAFDLIEQAGNWVKTEVLGLDLDRRAAAESQDPTISEPAKQAIEAERAEFQDNLNESTNPLVTVPRDAARILVSGKDKQITGLAGGVSFLGDLAKTKLGLVDEEDQWNNVDHANYSSLNYNSQIAQPTSAVGQFASEAVAFISATRVVGALPGLSQGTKAANALTNPAARFTAQRAMEGLVGGVTDFMMDPGDANASNAIMEYIPGADANWLASLAGHGAAFLRDSAAGPAFEKLAHDADDNEWDRRLKNSLEGAFIQQGVDAVGLLGSALKRAAGPGLKWLKAHPGKTSADIPAEIKAEQQAIFTEQLSLGLVDDVPTKPTGQAISVESWSSETFKKSYKPTDLDWDSATDAEITDLSMRFGQELVSTTMPIQRSMDVFGEAVTTRKLPNGAEVQWLSGSVSTKHGDAVRIDWNLHKGDSLGTGGTRLYRQFGEVAKEHKPGTIIQAEAAADGYGAKGKSSAQSREGPAMQRYKEQYVKDAEPYYLKQFPDDDPSQVKEFWESLSFDEKLEKAENLGQTTELGKFDINQGQEVNIREKLYKRAGLSEPDEMGKMYGIVKYKPDGRKTMQPLDPTKPIQEQVDEAMDSAKQYELGIDFDSADVRPGKFDRLKEDYENGGSRFQVEYEPFERAGKSAEFDIVDVARQQDYHADGPTQGMGAPSPHMTDNTIRQLNEAGMSADLIEATAEKAASSLRQRLMSSETGIRDEALEQIRKWHRQNPVQGQDFSTNNEALLEIKENAYGVKESYIRTLAGNNVAKVLITDIAQQMTEIGGSAAEIAQTGMTPNRQLNMLLDRLNSITILQIEDASNRGGALASLKGKLGFGTSPDTVKTKIKEATDKIEDLRTKVNEGDVKAVEDLMVLADAMKLADGRPDIALKFSDKFFSYSREMFEVTMYNSYLSGLVTQERNILGNAWNVWMKPLDIIMGSQGKMSDYKGAVSADDLRAHGNRRKAALSMYSSMLNSYSEGYKILKLALKENNVDIMSKTMSTAGENMSAKLDNLSKEAHQSGDWGKIFAVDWGLRNQYRAFANPWLQQATRTLDATDKAFRVVSARQKAHYDMMMNVLDDFDGDASKFSPKKLETDLKSKIKENGEIVDQQLLGWAKEDTFQEELGWRMQTFQNMLNDNPILKYSVPFVKTPTNILKRTGQYTPFINRFLTDYDEVMKGTDEVKKAIYKGREAQGMMIGQTFTTFGFMGLSTGAGPQDPNLRKTWEENNEPHSFKIGGVWVSNRFLGPIGILMSVYSDLGLIGANAGSYDNFADAGSQLVYTTAGALFEQSWAKGLFSIMDTLNDVLMGRTVDPEAGMAQLSRAMLPYQAAFRGLSNAITPGLREYDSHWQKLLAETVPFTKAHLGADRISPFTGKPVANQGLSAINQMSPFGLDEIRNDKAVNYMVQYGVSVPYKFMDEYKDIKLLGEDHKRLNKYMASGGLDGKGVRGELIEYFEGEDFELAYKEWSEMQPPVAREQAQWYRNAKRIWAQHRKDAVTKYINSGTPEANAFADKVQAVDLRDHFMRMGLYDEAARFQEQIKNF